jgi:hypothetical protein
MHARQERLAAERNMYARYAHMLEDSYDLLVFERDDAREELARSEALRSSETHTDLEAVRQ